jgi:hypothetical protein
MTKLKPAREIANFAVIIRCIHERGPVQREALLELNRRGLWLSMDQIMHAELSEPYDIMVAKGAVRIPHVGWMIKFHAPCRWSDRAVWRKVVGHDDCNRPCVRFGGWSNFVVHPNEILEMRGGK